MVSAGSSQYGSCTLTDFNTNELDLSITQDTTAIFNWGMDVKLDFSVYLRILHIKVSTSFHEYVTDGAATKRRASRRIWGKLAYEGLDDIASLLN